MYFDKSKCQIVIQNYCFFVFRLYLFLGVFLENNIDLFILKCEKRINGCILFKILNDLSFNEFLNDFR